MDAYTGLLLARGEGAKVQTATSVLFWLFFLSPRKSDIRSST